MSLKGTGDEHVGNTLGGEDAGMCDGDGYRGR